MPTNPWCQKRKKFPKNLTVTVVKPQPRALRKCRPVSKNNNLAIKPTMWQDIVAEDKELENYIRKQKEKNLPAFECASSYIQRVLYPTLVPAFEKLCAITVAKGAHCKPIRFFDFIDGLAELLYNTNSAHSERHNQWKSIHLIFLNRKRPCFPYHWFLTPDMAAVTIQAMIRGFLVRRKVDLVAMRVERRKINRSIAKQMKCNTLLKNELEKNEVCKESCRDLN